MRNFERNNNSMIMLPYRNASCQGRSHPGSCIFQGCLSRSPIKKNIFFIFVNYCYNINTFIFKFNSYIINNDTVKVILKNKKVLLKRTETTKFCFIIRYIPLVALRHWVYLVTLNHRRSLKPV